MIHLGLSWNHITIIITMDSSNASDYDHIWIIGMIRDDYHPDYMAN
jgi:hypothetical protein